MDEQSKSPVDLQAHYLSLITEAVEAAGGFCMILPKIPTIGDIYVSRSSTTTKAEYLIRYIFQQDEVAISVSFEDGRPQVRYTASYVHGLDDFFPLFAKALRANRLTAVQS